MVRGALSELSDQLAGFAPLSEPLRRRLYVFVVEQGRPVGRAAAAAAAGVPRTVAAFHLDRLVEAGLLEVTYGRTTARRGPGSGRPAKLYRRASREHRLSLPPRSYELAAHLLAQAVDRAGADGLLYEIAERDGVAAGRGLRTEGEGDAGEALRRATEALARLGYEPAEEAEGTVRLRNCPFHALSQSAERPLVCGMNLAWLSGVVDGLGAGGLDVRLDPRPDSCCVAISNSNIG
jgi:predicted ArsR family transcriptional regulator